MSLTGIGLIAIPISTATAFGLSIGSKVIFEIIINKHNKHEKQYERHQQTNKSFDKFYKKSSQDNVIDRSDYQSLCNVFTKYVDEFKKESLLKYEYKNKI